MAKPEPPGALRLLAMDEEDLGVISAALQDAVLKVGDIAYEKSTRRLTLIVNRFRWEGGRRERVRAAFQLGDVESVQTRRIRRTAKDAVLELLAVSFEPGEAPGGVLTLAFAGGGDLRATVECIDAVLADLSAPWPTPREPGHAA
jgi:hypothetical protein